MSPPACLILAKMVAAASLVMMHLEDLSAAVEMATQGKTALKMSMSAWTVSRTINPACVINIYLS